MQKRLKNYNYKRIGLHILFWLIVFVVNFVLYSYTNGKYKKIFLALLTTFPIDIFAAYITIYFFIPKYLLKRNYLKFSIWFLLSVVIIVLLERYINLYFVYPNIYKEPTENIPAFFSINIVFLAINIYKVVALAAVIKLIKIWYHNQKLESKLENLNLNSELAQLRNQINPHFLFNTLNNIDTLISKDTSKASDAIIKLSDIMRYMLYEANVEKVPLSKEIEYLKGYISLQKLRFKEKDFVTFNIVGDTNNKTISPMLFISFVENAFKHGSKKINESRIQIQLLIEKKQIYFECKNHYSNKNNKDSTKGIGLDNVKRRLALLYPNKHNLVISEENSIFTTQLTLYK